MRAEKDGRVAVKIEDVTVALKPENLNTVVPRCKPDESHVLKDTLEINVRLER